MRGFLMLAIGLGGVAGADGEPVPLAPAEIAGLHRDLGVPYVFLSLERTPAEELPALHRLQEQFTKHPGVAHRHALLLFALGYAEEARAAYRRAKRTAPDWEFIMFHALRELDRPGGTPDPLTAYHDALHVDRRHPEIRWALGFLALAAGRDEDALEHYGQWVALTEPAAGARSAQSSWQAAAWYNHALAAHRAGRPDLARQLLDRLDRSGASSSSWRIELLRGHLALGAAGTTEALTGALPAFQLAARLGPAQVAPAIWTAWTAAALREWAIACSAVTAAVRLDPRSTTVRRTKDHVETRLMDAIQGAVTTQPDTAVGLADLLLTWQPGHEEGERLRGEARIRLETARSAEARLAEAVALEPVDPARALACYRAVLRDHPDHPVAGPKADQLARGIAGQADAAHRRAVRAHREGRLRDTLAAVEEALSADPAHAQARSLRREAAERQARAAEAQSDIDRWALAGEVEAAEGRWAEAVNLWKKAVELDYYNASLRDKIRFAEQQLNTASPATQAEQAPRAGEQKTNE